MMLLAVTPVTAQTPPSDQVEPLRVGAAAVDIVDHAVAICVAVIFDGQTFETAVEGKPWDTMDPRQTGSNLATHAWRAQTLNRTFLMRLGNGGCSFGVLRGDGEAMRARVMERLAVREEFVLVDQEATRGGRATRYAYCGRAAPHPYLVSTVVGTSGGEPHFVFNMFRASDPAPTFCGAATAPAEN